MDLHHDRALGQIVYGNAVRSRNGNVVATVRALPTGTGYRDEDEPEPRDTAVITIYDIITNDGAGRTTMIKKREDIEVPLAAGFYVGRLRMALSNGGELISVDMKKEAGKPFWAVYDLTNTPCGEPVLKVDPVANSCYLCLVAHQFTPDNELLVVVGECLDHETFLQETEMPACLAKNMIIIKSDREW